MINTGNMQNMQGMMGPRGGTAGLQQNQNGIQRPAGMNEMGLFPMQKQIYTILQRQQFSPGWQQTLELGVRVHNIFQVVSSLRLLKPMSVQQAVDVAMSFEKNTLDESADRASYDTACRNKLQHLQGAREKQAAHLESQMRLSNPGQMNMEMQQGAMQPGVPNGRPGQFQQGYANAQLQRSVQASPISIQQQQMQNFQQQQQPHSVGNNPLGAQTQIHPSQRPPNQPVNQPQPIANSAGNPVLSTQETHQLMMLAQQLRQSCPPKELQDISQRISNAPDATKKEWERKGIDPIALYFQQSAKHRYLSQKRTQQQQMQTAMSGMPTAPQQPSSMPQNSSSSGAQQFGAMTAVQGFDNTFGGSIQQFGSQILGLQQDGIRSQEEGQVVVPVSGTQQTSQQQSQGMVQPGQQQQSSLNQSNSARSMMNHPQFMVQQEKVQQVQRLQAQGRIQNAGGMQNHIGQQNNLQGQAGGLNNPVNQALPQQSPAMPNLNRPLGPSPQPSQQQGPSQARQQAFASQSHGNDAGSINQHNQQQQQLQAQGGSLDAGLGSTDQSQAHQFNMSQLPLPMKQKLSTLPPEQQKMIMMRLMQKNMNAQNRDVKGRAQPNGMVMPGPDVRIRQPQPPQGHQFLQQIPGQTPNMPNAEQFGLSVSQPQEMSTGPMPGQQNTQGQGLGQKFLGPNQQPMPPSRVAQGAGKPLSEEQIRVMDGLPFPPTILSSGVMVPPQTVRLWGELKAWVAQNINTLPRDILDKLKSLQALVFNQMVQKSNQNQQLAMQQSLMSQGMQSMMPVPQAGPAPQVSMLQSRGSQQSVQNSAATAFALQQNLARQPSAQDLQNIRDMNPQYSNMTDDQLRQGIMKRKMDMMNMQRQNMNSQQTQMESMQRAQFHQLQRQAMLGVNQNHQGPPHQRTALGQQPISQGAQATTPSMVQAPVQDAPHAQVSRPSTRPSNQQPHGNKGTKRNNEDEVVEISNPKLAQRNQQQQQQQRKTQPPSKQPPAQQKPTSIRGSRETPSSTSQQQPQSQAQQQQQQQSSQYELELRKQVAQSTSVNPSQQLPSGNRGNLGPGTPQPTDEQQTMMRKRYQQMVNEVRQSLSTRKEVPMDKKTREQMATLLKQQKTPIQRAESMEFPLYLLVKDEEKTKDLIRARMITTSQFRAGENNLIDRFTLTQNELNESLLKVMQYFGYLRAYQKQKQQQQQPSNSTENSMKPAVSTMTANKSGGELQSRQAPRQNTMQRNHSNRDNRAPAAPTSDKPPFSFTAQSPTPDGVPVAYGATSFSQDKMNIPAAKKRKIQNQSGSSVTTPIQTQGTPTSTISPKSTKMSSPQMQRSNGATSTIKCKEPSCESASKGFATAEDLAKHTKEKHQSVEPPIEDPLEWALEGIRIGLGIGEDGKSKVITKDKELEKPGPTAPAMKQSTSMQGLTPIKMEAGTPMSRVSTQQGYQNNLGLPRTPQQGTAMVKTPSSDTKSLLGKITQADADKAGPTTKLPSTPSNNYWNDISISPSEIFAYFPSDADLQGCASLTSLTPASTLSSSKSEKNSPKASDIGEGDGLDIHIAADDWLPPGFFGDAFPPPDPSFLDDDLFSMGWDESFGSAEAEDGKGGRAGVTGEIDTFDASLFSFNA